MGIVSEADLLLKEADPTPQARPHLLESHERRQQRSKALGQSAAGLMTSPMVTIKPDETLAAAARLMHHQRIKRLPVVDAGGRLLGMVSRADILKVYLRADGEIGREVVQDVILRALWMDPRTIEVSVHDGVVTLSGVVDRRSDISILVRMAAGVEGVLGVREDLSFRFDDTHAVYALAGTARAWASTSDLTRSASPQQLASAVVRWNESTPNDWAGM